MRSWSACFVAFLKVFWISVLRGFLFFVVGLSYIFRYKISFFCNFFSFLLRIFLRFTFYSISVDCADELHIKVGTNYSFNRSAIIENYVLNSHENDRSSQLCFISFSTRFSSSTMLYLCWSFCILRQRPNTVQSPVYLIMGFYLSVGYAVFALFWEIQ